MSKTNEVNEVMFGIDLGTTNSAISVLLGSGKPVPKIIELSSKRATMPSCVMWSKEDGFTVGYEAYVNRFKPNAVYSIKRYMGSDHKTTLTDEQGNSITMLPEEVSAEIIKALCVEAELQGYGKVYNVTITVPAYFNELQRKATIKAGELAGLNVVSTINEPTSAALAYGLDKNQSEGNVLVYDLGGGTFDASLLTVEHVKAKKKIGMINLGGESKEQSIVRVISNGGNNMLGGDDVDTLILESLCKDLDALMLKKGHEINSLEQLDKVSIEKLKLSIEKAKKKYSPLAVTVVSVEGTLNTGLSIKQTIPLTYDAIQKATKEIFNKTLKSVNECLSTTVHKDFGRIVLVGGSTKSEILRELIRKQFPNKVIYAELNPDESIAIGASVNTGIQMGKSDMSLFDVIPLPIGIKANVERMDGKVSEDMFQKIIQKDSQLPAKSSYVFNNTDDSGLGVILEVYQGLKRKANQNVLLGYIHIPELPELPAGEVEIKVNILVDLSGVLSVEVDVDGKLYNKTFSSVFSSSTSTSSDKLIDEIESIVKGGALTDSEYIKVSGTYKADRFSMSKDPIVNEWFDTLEASTLTAIEKKAVELRINNFNDTDEERNEINKLLKLK